MKSCCYFLVVFFAIAPFVSQAGEPIFIPTKIDGPVHDPANHTYWFGPFCECASVLDVDNDGDLDIASGRNWYEAPNWTKHPNFRDGAETNGPETDNNSEFAMDVNFDGWTDIVSS
ncbi:MAG: FG-GAP repeat domain-containing protein, partial [Planctomycetota bacterium]